MDGKGLKQAKKKAREVFGDSGEIEEWFKKDNEELNGKKPKECELNEVLDLILKIEYGT